MKCIRIFHIFIRANSNLASIQAIAGVICYLPAILLPFLQHPTISHHLISVNITMKGLLQMKIPWIFGLKNMFDFPLRPISQQDI